MRATMSPRSLVVFSLAFTLVACPSPKMPDGPPPEYEDPEAPSWYDAGPDAAAAPDVIPTSEAQDAGMPSDASK